MLAIVTGVLGLGIPASACCYDCCKVTMCWDDYRVAWVTGCLDRTGDESRYSTTLRGGVTYRIVLRVPWGPDFDMAVYDENGNRVGSRTRGGSCDEIVTITLLWTGRFFIRVWSFSGRGCYTLELYR
jgi:hypothetical protein